MNLDAYIGLPYREGARGPDAYDCYGIVAAVFRAAHGVSLPDFYQDASGPGSASRAISAAVRGQIDGGGVIPVEEPQDWDIAIVGSGRNLHHVGLYVHGGILHATRQMGSAWQPLSRFRLTYPCTEFVRWHP